MKENRFLNYIYNNKQKLATIICIIILIFVGFSWLFHLPSVTVKLNASKDYYLYYKAQSATQSVKVSAGFSEIKVYGPKLSKDIKVFTFPFTTKTISITSADQNISNEDIMKQGMETYGSYSNYYDMCKDFSDNWIVCRVSQGSAQSVAMHYENGNWVVYFRDFDVTNPEAKIYMKQIILITNSEGMEASDD